MAASLPQEARQYLNKYIDPADAFLAWTDGLTQKQARSRARNAARALGSSWPDRLPTTAIDDCEVLQSHQVEDPAALLEALEIASSVHREELEAAGVAALLDSISHAPGADLARNLGLTHRRGQQIRAAQRRALEAGQQDLFAKDEI